MVTMSGTTPVCVTPHGAPVRPRPQRAHADAADEVEVGVAVDVGDGGAARVIDGDPGEETVALRPGREVLVLARPQRAAPRPGDLGDQRAVLVRGLARRHARNTK